MESNRKERNSSIELLRIICIIGVIICHFCGHGALGNVELTYSNVNWQLIISQIGSLLGNIANYTFIIITGYFMINSKFKIKKIITLIIQIFFYAWIISILAYILGLWNPNDSINILKTILPIFFSYNWFVNCYIVLYIFSPFINTLANALDRKQFGKLLLIILIIGIILPKFKATTYLNSDFIYFLFMYLLGGYIKLHIKEKIGKFQNSVSLWGKLLAVFVILEILSVIILDTIGLILKKDFFVDNACFFNPFFAILISTSLFMVFNLKKTFTNKRINQISQTVLGIYLIHDNPIIRDILWNKYFRIDFYESNYYILYLIVEVVSIFIICYLIENIRLYIFDKTKMIVSRIRNYEK